MSNPRRPVRGKPERSKAQNGLALSGKPAKSKTQDTGKTAPKPTTVAAEIGAPATRKEPASVPPTPVQRPSAPAAANLLQPRLPPILLLSPPSAHPSRSSRHRLRRNLHRLRPSLYL